MKKKYTLIVLLCLILPSTALCDVAQASKPSSHTVRHGQSSMARENIETKKTPDTKETFGDPRANLDTSKIDEVGLKEESKESKTTKRHGRSFLTRDSVSK